MSQEVLEQLQAVDVSLLTGVVRQAQRKPAYEILDWSVRPINHQAIIDTTGGLYCYSGVGRDDEDTGPWSVVFKMINPSAEEECRPEREWCYWKRELLAFGSGMLGALPGPIRAPRCFGVAEREAGGSIWMEHIVEATGRSWSQAEFARAAYELGGFAGAQLTGTAVQQHPWLCKPFFRSIFADGNWWSTAMATDTEQSIWRNPIVERGFSPDLRTRVLAVWAEKQRFLDTLDRLPQVLCHNDCHRRNLMWRNRDDGQRELVVLDWAFCGMGAAGMDLGELVAVSSYFFDSSPFDVETRERAAFKSYVDGLGAAGWTGDTRLIRLGYITSAVLWMGATLPGWAAIMLDPAAGANVTAQYGRPADEVLNGWVALTESLMDRADEARSLMASLFG